MTQDKRAADLKKTIATLKRATTRARNLNKAVQLADRSKKAAREKWDKAVEAATTANEKAQKAALACLFAGPGETETAKKNFETAQASYEESGYALHLAIKEYWTAADRLDAAELKASLAMKAKQKASIHAKQCPQKSHTPLIFKYVAHGRN